MRFLGPALIVLSLLLSTGGVAVHSQAESDAIPEPQAQQQSLVFQTVPLPQGQCAQGAERAEPKPGARGAIDLTELEKRAPRGFVPLNGAGYNYSDPNVWRPEVPNRKSKPPAALDPASDSVPAAPQR